MTLATALRDKRRLDGLTQTAAAETMGVSQQTVAKWELGTTRPRSKPQIESLARFLGMDYKDVLVLVYEEPVGEDRQALAAALEEVEDLRSRVMTLERRIGLTIGKIAA